MYVKVVLDGQIIDAIKDLCCCKFDKRSNMVLRCDIKENPCGIISERTGEIYQVDGWSLMPDNSRSAGVVTIEYINEDEYMAIVAALDANGPVPQPDVDIDIPPNATVEFVKESVIKKMSTACNAVITGGVDVVLSDGIKYHFSLSLEDQLNLISLQGIVLAGAESVPYHADGEECRYYSAADFQSIANAATSWKIYHESYFNTLRGYIQSMTTIQELMDVNYGMAVPDEYMTDVYRILVQQMEESL